MRASHFRRWLGSYPLGMAFGAVLVCAFVGCGPSEPPTRVTGNLSGNDVTVIENIVREDIRIRVRTNTAHPITSIEEMTNHTVEVWFKAKELRWGEGGYILEHTTNTWKITAELFR